MIIFFVFSLYDDEINLPTYLPTYLPAGNIAPADKTSGKSSNRCLKQRATLRFSQAAKLPKDTACLNCHFKPDCMSELTLVVSMQKNYHCSMKCSFPAGTCLKLQKCWEH